MMKKIKHILKVFVDIIIIFFTFLLMLGANIYSICVAVDNSPIWPLFILWPLFLLALSVVLVLDKNKKMF